VNSGIVCDLHHPEVSSANALADAVEPSDVRVSVSVESQEGLEIVVMVIIEKAWALTSYVPGDSNLQN